MKVETLNIWGGRVTLPLLEHLEKQSESIDIFCFQEVLDNCTANPDKANVQNIYSQMSEVLSEFQGWYHPTQTNDEGLAIFAHRSICVKHCGNVFVHRNLDAYIAGDNSTLGRNAQYLTIDGADVGLTVFNFHGLWNGNGKSDTPDRIKQSRKLKRFMNSFEGETILCGDFNLDPHTRGLFILEDGMHNFIKQYGIISTRTSLYPKPGRFADYILATPGVKVNDFRRLPDEVSDHSPLTLDFSF